MNENKSEANSSHRVIEITDNRLTDSSISSYNALNMQTYSSSAGQTMDAFGEKRGKIRLPTEEALLLQAKPLISSSECQDANHTTTTATSSGSGGNEDTVISATNQHGLPPRKKFRHCYTTSIKSQSSNDDGSTLQVPGDNGSDRIVAGAIEGGVPIEPATVVASRLFTPHTTGTDNCLSSPSTLGTEGELSSSSETSTQNQHHLLLTPHREPRYHTIRNSLYRFQSSDDNGNGYNKYSHRSNRSKKSRPSRSSAPMASTNTGSMKSKHSTLVSSNFFSGNGTDGTEDGYAGSVSSNENGSGNHQLRSSSPSPSVTSSEECEQLGGRHKTNRVRRKSNFKQNSSRATQEEGDDPELSSEIADFDSSGSSETMDEEDVGNGRGDGDTQTFGMKAYSSSSSPSLSSSNYSNSHGLEMSFMSAKRDADAEHERMLKMITRRKKPKSAAMVKPFATHVTSSKHTASKNLEDGRPPILAMGCDVMAHVLTFLHPLEILDVLTMPLSKCWRQNFTSQAELWRVLCLVEPFKAILDDPTSDKKQSGSLSDGTYCSIKTGKNTEGLLDKYRLLYTSFVRCMKYVSQIRDDAINGRPPAYIDYGISGTFGGAPDMHSDTNVTKTTSGGSPSPPPPTSLGSNRNLQVFLAQARGVVLDSSNNDDTSNSGGETKSSTIFPSITTAARVGTALKKKNTSQEKMNGLKFGRSMITSRLFGSVPGNEPKNLNLPWSCAIYSIVNWMVAFSDVEGLQTLCLKVLPVLLENEQHRLTAQHAGLADVVLRAMVMFSESAQLHIAAFHTIVLLARPHGGSEGMMFRTSMTAGGIFRGIYQRHGKSGIAVMLDSMRRFQDNAALLAMSCWALVNIALVSDQKAVLVKLGGIQAITNAMSRHPFSAELQFRALFALINLVIPSVQKLDSNGSDSDSNNGNENNGEGADAAASLSSESEQLGELNETTEKEIIDELVRDIASLVVHVMKNFCSSEAILNRACLVLHNLSLTDDYHVILLWTPQCYQMLEWCVANFRSDQVLQQSATGTLYRLQSTLASDEDMRLRFSKSLRTQQQLVTLKQARREVR